MKLIVTLFVAFAVFHPLVTLAGDDLPDLVRQLEQIKAKPMDGEERLNLQLAIIKKIAAHGRESIPFLLQAVKLRGDSPDNYDWELRDLLAAKCKEFPDEFSQIIKDKRQDVEKRWDAVHAVRQAEEKRCFTATAEVFNDPREPQDLRIQALLSFPALKPEEVRPLAKGIVTLLKENPRPSDLENVIELAEYGGIHEAVPVLIPLLDERDVYSYTVEDDGKNTPNRISDKALKALRTITDKNLPPNRAAWEKALGAQ